MSDSLLPTKASAKFLDYTGLALILMPIDVLGARWIGDQPIYYHQWVAAFAFLIAGAISLGVGGTWWDKVKATPSGRLAVSFDAVAHNAITWLVVAAVIVFGVPAAMGLISSPIVSAVIGLIIAVLTMALLAAIFRRGIHGQIGQPLSHQELDYRTEQRKFILSNLDEILNAYLTVMSMISDKCGQTGNALTGQINWFAEFSLQRGIRRQYGELKKAAENGFVDISSETINEDILKFLKEYEIVSHFPGKIEMAAGLGKTTRDQWDAAHQRCRSALRDLKASSFSGIIAESTAMETLQTMPRNR